MQVMHQMLGCITDIVQHLNPAEAYEMNAQLPARSFEKCSDPFPHLMQQTDAAREMGFSDLSDFEETGSALTMSDDEDSSACLS